MGTYNQLSYLKTRAPHINGAVLEVGSKNYGNTQDFRDLYKGHEYVGLDIEDGPNVDVVCDLTQGIANLPEKHFDLIIICSVMEHTPTPWLLAQNVERLLKPGGMIYSAHPWVWRHHNYPDDYFRFSHSAIKSLFPSVTCWAAPCYATTVNDEFYDAHKYEGIDNHMAIFGRDGKKYLPNLDILMLGSSDKARIDALKPLPEPRKQNGFADSKFGRKVRKKLLKAFA